MLRLTTSRPAGYRRGGIVIGSAAAPTLLSGTGEVTPEGFLAILADPNIDMAFEVTGEDGKVSFRRVDVSERIVFAQEVKARLADDLAAGLGGGNIELELGTLAALNAEPKRPFAGLGAVIPGRPEQIVGDGLGKPDVDGVTSSQSVPAQPVTAPIDLTGAPILQPASGVAGEIGGGASAPVDPITSGDASADSDTSISLPGTGTSSADVPGEPREKADAPNGTAVPGADVGNQPEETSLPPVADAALEKGPSVAPAAGKSAGKAKPKGATQTRAD